MKIEIGKTYVFTKSGNAVRVLEACGKRKGQSMWTVERTTGASAGKRMIVDGKALKRIEE